MPNEDLGKLKIDKSKLNVRSRRRVPKIVLWIPAVVLLLLVVMLLRGRAIDVETAVVSRVYPSQAFTILNASGYVVAQRKAAVAAKATGRLVWIGVEEGSKVEKGQVIARLEDNDVVAARNQAAANLANARAALVEAQAELEVATLDYNRNSELFKKGFISRSEFDAAEARYKRAQAAVAGANAAVRAAQAALNAAEVAVEYTRIRAPFDAVVLTKDADVGDIVTPLAAAAEAKASVVTIADMSSLQVEADVAESNILKVRVGQPAEIHLDALPDDRFPGRVHMIVPTADRTKASVQVKVRFLEAGFRILPEMSARVAFLSRSVRRGEDKPITAVATAALATRDGGTVVFVVTGDRVVERQVVPGRKRGDLVEIREGLKPGDKVVVNPSGGLEDGSRVSVAAQ